MLDNSLETKFTQDKDAAIKWARIHIEVGEYVILDTETTGLSGTDEVIQVAIIDPQGRPLVSTGIKPTANAKMSSRALELHGITLESLQDAPPLSEVLPEIVQAVKGKTIIAWNADFDMRLLAQSCTLNQLDWPDVLSLANVECAMRKHAAYYGQWNTRMGSYTWQKLPGGGAHSAATDAECVRVTMHTMAANLTHAEVGQAAAMMASLAEPIGVIEAATPEATEPEDDDDDESNEDEFFEDEFFAEDDEDGDDDEGDEPASIPQPEASPIPRTVAFEHGTGTVTLGPAPAHDVASGDDPAANGHAFNLFGDPCSQAIDLLSLVGVVVDADTVAGWTAEQCATAAIWAAREHLAASDNDVPRKIRPDFLPAATPTGQ